MTWQRHDVTWHDDDKDGDECDNEEDVDDDDDGDGDGEDVVVDDDDDDDGFDEGCKFAAAEINADGAWIDSHE